ncbi:MAG: lipase family protein [Spirochaetales bacterium]|nr:lipase family protein [Spirochaetales bacterium]
MSCSIKLFLDGDEEISYPLEEVQVRLLYLENDKRKEGLKTDFAPEPFFSAGSSAGALFETGDDLYIMFFGSDKVIDFYFNIVIDLVSTDFLPGDIKVHAGFLHNYEGVRDRVMEGLDSYLAGGASGTIYIVGHSAGGAAAIYCAADLITNRGIDDRLYIVAGGTPRPGNHSLKALIENSNARCHRIVNGSDMIPTVPPESMGYTHTGIFHRIGPKPNPLISGTMLWIPQHLLDGYCDTLDKGLYQVLN